MGTPKNQSAGTARQPMQEPAGGWPIDQYHGQFGRFVRDPYTGKRFPADEGTAKAFGQAWPPAAGSEHVQALEPSEPASTPVASQADAS